MVGSRLMVAAASVAFCGLVAVGCQKDHDSGTVQSRTQDQTVRSDGTAVQTRTQVRETPSGDTVRETQTQERKVISGNGSPTDSGNH